MGPFSTKSHAVSVRTIVARFAGSPPFFARALTALFISYSLPRSAAIIFGLDVIYVDAEIALSPRSTEDRSLCFDDDAAARQRSPLAPLKIIRSACTDRSAVITTLRSDNALPSLH